MKADKIPSLLQASNEFLNRELQRLEVERDTIRAELEQIHHSYAWRVVDSYRRWLARHSESPAVRLYEKLALWMLNRTLGSDQLDQNRRYHFWIESHALTPERAQDMRAEAARFPYRPTIGVVLRVGPATIDKYLATAIDSVRAQIYDNWELHIASEGSYEPSVEATVERYAAGDSRIAAIPLDDLPPAEFITFLDQFDELGADAFYEVAKRLNRNPLSDLFYWDEDKLIDRRRTDPFFKPDWSPDLLLSMSYIGNCFIIRRTLVEQVGAPHRSFAPCENYDLALRVVERTNRIVHIPKVLYHRHSDAVAESPVASGASQPCPPGIRTIGEALRRRGEPGRVEVISPGLYAVRYEISGEPLVSILIPTRDKWELLRQCLESIDASTDYKNYEIIVLDNDSRAPETLEYFKEISGKVKLHHLPGPFNFSKINNLGAAKAAGEFLLFLNNDTQVIRRDWMRAMIEQAQRPAVGAVGAKLLFADDRIQHAGIVLGLSGTVGHAFRFTTGDPQRHRGLADAIRNCSAVTAACMMMRRSVFEEVGGFDEKLAVDFNDIDLCCRLRQRGYLIVYTPLALLRHYESATRRRMRVAGDREVFLQRWSSYLKRDPYYNGNLTRTREDWTVAP